MSEAVPLAYVNGRFVRETDASLSPLDRGFTLADGVFETMVARDDRVFRLRDHLARLRRDAAMLHLRLPPTRTLAGAVGETLRRNGHEWAVARLTVSRGVDRGWGLDVRRGLTPTVVVRTGPWQGPPEAPPPARRLALSPYSRNDRSPLSRAKTLAYVQDVVAREEARRRGAHDALLCNTRGLVGCASSSNVFVFLEGALVTPPVEDGVLPGIARSTLLAVAENQGIAAREESLTPEDVARADEAFLSNVGTGPVPVASLDGRRIGPGVPGPVTARLVVAYWARVRRSLR